MFLNSPPFQGGVAKFWQSRILTGWFAPALHIFQVFIGQKLPRLGVPVRLRQDTPPSKG